ncbi:MAG: ABC transporter permease [Draconibacterium sp.]|nr:ABC transporter permease [Draconibacterium sp.]
MNLPLFIARRYFVSKKKQNIINIISAISVGGIIVGTMALIIVLSVFNGFQSLINTFFSSFDPDLKISPVEGKMFDPKEFDFEKIKSLPGVVHYAEIIEEVALLKYGTQTYAAVVKGVPENFQKYTIIDSLIIDGKFILENQGINYTVVGQGVAYNLGIRPEFTDPLLLYVPKKGKQVSVNPARAINHNYIFPSGVFAVLEEIDAKYIIVSHKFAAELFESDDQVSTVEIGLAKDINPKKIQNEIEKILGSSFPREKQIPATRPDF